MKRLQININSTVLTLVLAVYFTLFLNMALTRHLFDIFLNMDNANPIMIETVFFFFIFALNILFIPFSVKYLEKPFFIFLVITASLVNFASYQYKVIFDPDMMANIFETTSAEAGSYFNFTVLIWVSITGLLPAFLIYNANITHFTWRKDILVKIGSVMTSLAVILLIAMFFYKDYAAIARNHHSVRREIVPTYSVISTVKYLKHTYFYKPIPYTVIGADAVVKKHDKPNLTVFIVGETARAQNYQLNGYKRQTNKYSQGLPNLISFQNVRSCGTATAVSLPCMFSMMDKENYSRKEFKNQDKLTDIIKRTGIEQLWVENNTGCKGICNEIKHITISPDTDKYCDGSVCRDDVFLTDLQDKIDAMKGKDSVIYLHIMGSHGPTYFKRYSDQYRQFSPDCDRSDIQNCTDEQIINAYDNTIAFTDYIMSQAVKTLDNNTDNFNATMLYVSDHGESLGENGLYLHGLPYALAPDEQTRVPFILWMENSTIKDKNIDMECLQDSAKSNLISHDFVSHTLLGMMDIKTSVYDPAKDVLSSCRSTSQRDVLQ
jgi:lipid A ethanolaminephosphotransferase